MTNEKSVRQIQTAKCNYCGKVFPVIVAEIKNGKGEKVTEQIPVVPMPLPAFKKAPSIISATGRGLEGGLIPTLTDRLEGVFVFLPHELVCDRRHRAMNGSIAPGHESIPEAVVEAFSKPVIGKDGAN